MLKIRLQRAGRRNRPFYRIVVAEHSAPIKGKFVELLGHYNPVVAPKILEFKKERVEYWVSLGAQPSQTLARMLIKNGLKSLEKFVETRVMKPSRAEVEKKERSEREDAEAKKAKEEAAQAKVAAQEAPQEETVPETVESAPVEEEIPQEVAEEPSIQEEAPVQPEETAPAEDIPDQENA